MEAVIRALLVYFFLLIAFRIMGKRSLAEITTFDFVLLLIIGEAIQQGLLGEDFSLINAFVIVATLLSIEIVLSLLKQRSSMADKLLEGTPLLIVDRGKLLKRQMKEEKIDEDDILEAARKQGLERIEDVKYAILEKNGEINIIPR